MARMKTTDVDNQSRPLAAPCGHGEDSSGADGGVATSYKKKGKRKLHVPPAHLDLGMREPERTSATGDGANKAKKKGARVTPPSKKKGRQAPLESPSKATSLGASDSEGIEEEELSQPSK